MYKTNVASISRFLVPFYNEKSEQIPVNLDDFTRYEVKTKYLVESVYEIFRDAKDTECRCYYLNSESWGKYNLPPRFSSVNLQSEMVGCNKDFEIILSAIRFFYFQTGIGFLEIELQYPSDDIAMISDASFCISSIFTNEHDSGNQENRLHFSYQTEDGQRSFSFKNTILAILCADKHMDSLKLFPSNPRKKLLVYHSIITDPVDDIEKYVYALSNGLHGDIFYDENMDDNTGFSSISNQMWGISSTGVASVAYPNEDGWHFVENAFKRNTLYDYYYVFLLVVHEREILLKYNHAAVAKRSNPKALVAMKKDLLKLRVVYTYNTVSTESSYQSFYNMLFETLNIACLEADISSVIEAVESYVNDRKDRRINTILTALSLLAIFSILTDGITLVDRIQSGNPLGCIHWGIIGIVFIFCFIAIIFFKNKE